MRTMMAGIEEISGVRGDFYVRVSVSNNFQFTNLSLVLNKTKIYSWQRKIQYIDEHYLRKIFLNTTKSNSLTRLYEKLALTQHIAHLYGPVVLVEDRKAEILHENYGERRKKLSRSFSARQPNRAPNRASVRFTELFPGVQLRRKTLSDLNEPDPSRTQANEDKTSKEQLRRAFRASAYNKVKPSC